MENSILILRLLFAWTFSFCWWFGTAAGWFGTCGAAGAVGTCGGGGRGGSGRKHPGNLKKQSNERWVSKCDKIIDKLTTTMLLLTCRMEACWKLLGQLGQSMARLDARFCKQTFFLWVFKWTFRFISRESRKSDFLYALRF